MPKSRPVLVLLAAALAVLGGACGRVATTDAERARTFAPTPGGPTLRSVAGDTRCRLLETPAELPDVAQVVDTAALRTSFADEPSLSFGVVFDRAGGVDEVRRLEATTLTIEARREAIDRFLPSVRHQPAGEEWSVRVVRHDAEEPWRVERSVFCPARLVALGPASRDVSWYQAVPRVGEIHVSVDVEGTVASVFMPHARDWNAEAEVRRRYLASRFTAATMNGEAVPSIVLFGTNRAR